MDFFLPYITGSEAYPFPDFEPNSWMVGNAVDLLWFTSLAYNNATLWESMFRMLGFNASAFESSALNLHTPLPDSAAQSA